MSPLQRVTSPSGVGTRGESFVRLEPDSEKPKSRKKLWIILGIVIFILAAAGAVLGVLFGKNIISLDGGSKSAAGDGLGSESGTGDQSGAGPDSGAGAGGDSDDSDEEKSKVKCTAAEDIPEDAKGTYLDPTSWLDSADFNCTFTTETVGDLPIVGLFSEWDDSARANPNVPPLDESWGSYEKRPARGVNLGGWFSLEPFISPSMFDYDSDAGVVDEWTLCEHLGPEKAAEKLEEHYATWITEKDFKEIAEAGLDHLRIPFSYWAVETYEDDPFVYRVSWRYLLRAIEWARKYGLRVKLDLHGLPGSQNGWNHSGRQGEPEWLYGKNGDENAKRSLEIHDRLAKFFAQDRYKNVIVFYGLANEPAMKLDQSDVINWTETAYDLVKENGVEAAQVFSEGIQGLEAWHGKLTGYGDTLVVDAHHYTIFGGLISLKHAEKIEFACNAFMHASITSMDTSTGFGPTMVGEWSQADTDCTTHLNGLGGGTRWEGTWGDSGGVPQCPTGDDKCSCDKANEDPANYSDEYKLFLKTFAIAQMDAFEKTWGWFYWTWRTETAAQWSYKHGLDHGYMPKKAYDREWSCADGVPDLGDLPEYY